MNQANDTISFADYVRHGWPICPIPKGRKGPRSKGWNLLQNAIRDPEKAAKLPGNAGLLHAFNAQPTAALDVDCLDGTRQWFQGRGLDLDAMLTDPENVHLLSGREGRDKLLFQLPEGVAPLRSVKVCDPNDKTKTWFELRCAAQDGTKSVQDALPPSIHPDTGKPYYWQGDWRALPILPEGLLAVWRGRLGNGQSKTGKARPDPQPKLQPEPSAPSPENRSNPSLIAAFEKAYGNPTAIRQWLESKAYTYHGETGGVQRFLWPGSGSGEPGVALFKHDDGRWRVFSHHGGDPLAAEGKPLDALDIRAILWHDGNRKAALAAFDAERDPRPTVKMYGGHLHNTARKVAGILGAQNPPVVFQRGGVLTRVATLPEPLEQGNATIPQGQPVLVMLTPPDLSIRIMDVVRLKGKKPKSDEWIDTDCPAKLANTIGAMQGHDWRAIKPLMGLTEVPVLRPDGSVHDRTGYDPVSRLYYDGRCPQLKHLTDSVSRSSAIAAAEYLLEPFGQFPFSLPTDRAVLLALLCTLALRPQLPFAPMFAVGSTSPGSGKGLLIEAANVLVRGRYPATMCVPEDGDDNETRKAITSLLLAGVSAVHLDNWTKPVGGPVVNTLLTAQTWTDRILGFSKTPELPTRVTWMASGNGLAVRADQVRRSLYLHLDPRSERPETRKFDGPPLIERVQQDRPQLLAALFTVLRAYRQAGCPGQNDNLLGSFEEWSRQVAAPIRWLGYPDPIGSQEALRQEDPERQKLEAMLAGLWGVFKAEPFAVRDIARMATPSDFGPISPERQALAEVVADHFTERGDVNTRALGWFLRHFRGRIAGGVRLDVYREGALYNGKQRYFVQKAR
ncbi:hypothetical protein CCP4SC76_3290005 [Gammaproteobacteria bacterium]